MFDALRNKSVMLYVTVVINQVPEEADEKQNTRWPFFTPPPPPTPTVHTKSKSNMADRIAGGPRSSSCEVVILRKKSHGEVLRVCMGIFTTALRYNKDTVKFSTKILHLTSTLHRLLSDRLLC